MTAVCGQEGEEARSSLHDHAAGQPQSAIATGAEEVIGPCAEGRSFSADGPANSLRGRDADA